MTPNLLTEVEPLTKERVVTENVNRDKTACMMRVRNEGKWIRRSLERTFEVARTVVLLDDDSQDDTILQAHSVLGGTPTTGDKELHILHSPFRPGVRTELDVNEIRDKNFLWYYCKSRVDFDYMLCLDGDEMLSRQAIREFPYAINVMGKVNTVSMPFIYLWDSEDTRRVDGIYGDRPDGMAILRFPRLFTIKRVSPQDLFDSHFAWTGTRGGFHCGSIPSTLYDPVTAGEVHLPVIHFGYLTEELRQSKYLFYNTIDPGNKFEGEYRHIIGQPDQHAPGPVQVVPWSDV